MEEQGFDPKRLLEMLVRQSSVMVTIAVLVLAIAAIVAYVWPPTYRSTATILVEAQQIPQDFVRSTITTFADQRIQIISQTALARANLLDLIERYRLYTLRRSFETNDELVQRMRSSISVVPVTANANGRGEAVTIAFRVSFDYDDPELTQRVAGELTTLYLNANVKQRQDSTAETSSFVADESTRLRTQVEEIEARLETFKVRNAGRLPEQMVSSVQRIEQSRSDLDRLVREVAGLEDRRSFIEAQLEVLRSLPTAAATTAVPASAASDPAERLRTLRVQLASSNAVYSAAHPDTARLRREIESLEGVVSSGTTEDWAPLKQLLELKEKLVAANARYAPDHPEVTQLKGRITALEKVQGTGSGKEGGPGAARATLAGAGAGSGADAKAASPALMTMESQLESVRTQLRIAEQERGDLRERIRQHELRLAAAPGVEREYTTLTRDLANASGKYRDLSAKVVEAEVAQQLEKERKAERFTLLEPPLQPEAPIKPNRLLILAMGALLAIGTGVGCGLLRDLLDPSIRNPGELQRVTLLPLLAAIPSRQSRAELQAQRLRTRVLFAASGAALAAIALAIHLKVVPLNVAWAITARRLETLPAMLF